MVVRASLFIIRGGLHSITMNENRIKVKKRLLANFPSFRITYLEHPRLYNGNQLSHHVGARDSYQQGWHAASARRWKKKPLSYLIGYQVKNTAISSVTRQLDLEHRRSSKWIKVIRIVAQSLVFSQTIP